MRTRKGFLIFTGEAISQVHLTDGARQLFQNNLAHLESLMTCLFHDFIHSAQCYTAAKLNDNQNGKYVLTKTKWPSLEVIEGRVCALCNSSTDLSIGLLLKQCYEESFEKQNGLIER